MISCLKFFKPKCLCKRPNDFPSGVISSRTILARKLRFWFLVKKNMLAHKYNRRRTQGSMNSKKLKTFAWCRCWVCEFAVMLLRSIKLRAFDDYIKVLHPFLLFRPSSSLAGERSGFIVSCSLQKRKKCNDHVTSSTRERKDDARRVENFRTETRINFLALVQESLSPFVC